MFHRKKEAASVRSSGSLSEDGEDGEDGKGDEDSFLELDLVDFVIYGPERPLESSSLEPHVWEMKNLLELSTARWATTSFFAAGILASPSNDKRFWVQDIQFSILPISNYGRQNASVGDQIWICTKSQEQEHDGRHRVYYKLKTPAMEYARFWEPFYWVVNLAKHFVDFVELLLFGFSTPHEWALRTRRSRATAAMATFPSTIFDQDSPLTCSGATVTRQSLTLSTLSMGAEISATWSRQTASFSGKRPSACLAPGPKV